MKTKENDANKWWEKYPELSSDKFTYENSGRYNYAAAPYDCDYFSTEDVIFVPCHLGGTQGHPIGYTLNSPKMSKCHSENKYVGIMFEVEDKLNGGHVDMWWHWPI